MMLAVLEPHVQQAAVVDRDALRGDGGDEHNAMLLEEETEQGLCADIYCGRGALGGSLLAAVQSARLFQDSKHFVDMPLRRAPSETLAAWSRLLSDSPANLPTRASVAAFVDAYFAPPGAELEIVQPLDHHYADESRLQPKGIANIENPELKRWARALHDLWPQLTRQICPAVRAAPCRSSLLLVPHPFVVPGGRFREIYYWDSYFTIRGLLVSEMTETAKGMILNLGHLIERYGRIPNGNRVYYLNRSQPPLLSWCVDAYVQHTGDLNIARRAIRWIEAELEFWDRNRSVRLENWESELYQFRLEGVTAPRPESWREDMETASEALDQEERNKLWADLAAAAESGRDFSSRWYADEESGESRLQNTATSQLVPVELNGILCRNLEILAKMYRMVAAKELDGNVEEREEMERKAKEITERRQRMRRTIKQVLWNDESGAWFDYDLAAGKQRTKFFDTNLFPLVCGAAHDGLAADKCVEYLKKSGALKSGLPSSFTASGEQWDWPNTWAPTVWVTVEGLRLAGENETARQLARGFLRRAYTTWQKTGAMFEKYSVSTEATMGGGGEYEVQTGFGWTNGVALHLLSVFPDLEIGAEEEEDYEDEDGKESIFSASTVSTASASTASMGALI